MISLRDVDRLTIVYRKLYEAKLREESLAEKWHNVVKVLMPVASDENIEFAKIFALGALNAAIWQRMDAQRALKTEIEAGGSDLLFRDVGRLAFDLLRLNDWRAEIVGEEKFKGKEQV